jgi:hypothetical protein
MLDRFYSALVALSLAFLVWLYIRSRDQEVLDNVPVPVQITLASSQAEHYDLEIGGPAQVVMDFSGPPARIRELRGLLQRGELHVDVTLTVPEDRQNEGRYHDTVRIDAADVHPPPGVTPMIVEGRNRIPVTLYRIVERRLPVRLDQSLEDRISQVKVEPATVLVRGPQEVLDRARAILTQPYLLPNPRAEGATTAESMVVGPIPLVEEIDGRPVRATPREVRARITLQPRQRIYELADVPVHFLCPASFNLKPHFVGDGRDGRISLRIQGPAREEPVVHAYIDLTRRKFEPGLNEEPLQLQLPKDFTLAQNPPRPVPFRLDPVEPPLKAPAGESGR